MAGQINYIETTLKAGDCMYVPAYYYVQSQTIGVPGLYGETIMITEQYESHSKFIDVMMDAIEEERMGAREEKG